MDAELLRQARVMGAASLLQETNGLNEGLDEAESRPDSRPLR